VEGPGLIVETGYRYHAVARHGGPRQDLDLKLRGYNVVRFTHRQVVDEAAGVARTLRALLALRWSRVLAGIRQ
jgi:very-short-patch-repair endonuclease